MGGGRLRLPEVIVAASGLLLLLLLLLVARSRADDLLESVRQSKSNDPEVREFLRAVLQHHNDFRWIASTVDKYRSADTKGRRMGSRRQHRSAQSDDGMADDAEEFDGPVNDVYPYRDDLNAQERSFLDDELDERGGEPDALAAFVGDAPRPHASTPDELLDEKLMLRNLLRKAHPSRGLMRKTQRQRSGACPQTLEDTDFDVPELWNDTGKKKDESSELLADFYNEQTHDVLGMQRDVIAEERANTLACGSKPKRALNIAHLLRKEPKRAKAIKVNVYDKSQIVKRIERNESDNSLTIRIKSNQPPLPVPLSSTHKSLRHAQSQTSAAPKGPRHASISYAAISSTARPYSSTSAEEASANSAQNKLEDLTEPTSAAEQRELGRADNQFNTFPVFDMTTIGQLYVLPMKHQPSPKLRSKRLADDDASMQMPKAWAFRSRQLFADEYAYEYPEVDGAETKKPVRDIRTRLGMSRDEDYSEDKPTPSKKQRAKQRATEKSTTTRQKRKHKQPPPLVNLSSTAQERKALKNRMAQTTGNKVKKSSRHEAAPDEPMKKSKRELPRSPTDRCCENESSSSSTTMDEPAAGRLGEQNQQRPVAAGNGQSGELQIIEKTKAIVLHITGAPPVATAATAATEPGLDADDNDDDERRRSEDFDASRTEAPAANASDDVVSEIIRLVQKYKSRVDLNNGGRLSTPPHQYTTFRYRNDSDSRTMSGEDLLDVGDSEFHGHAAHHAKKLHPLKGCNASGFAPPTQREDVLAVTNGAPVEEYYQPAVVADDTRKQKREDHALRDEQYNQLQFTPDALETFKDGVDFNAPPKSSLEQDEEDDDAGQRAKRNARADGYYSDEEVGKLLSLINGPARHRSRRLRHPLLARPRAVLLKREPTTVAAGTTLLASTAITAETAATDVATAAVTSITSTPAASISVTPSAEMTLSTPLKMLPKCDDIEAEKQLGSCGGAASCHEKPSKEWREFKDKCEYGEPKHYVDHPKLSKSERRKEEQLRQDNILKLDRDHRINDRDEDDIRNMINGHISLDVIQKFLARLKENQRLNARFGRAAAKKCIQEDVDKLVFFRDEQCKADVKHAQLMLHQVIVMLNKIVTEQVHRRTCLMPSPDLRAHLQRIVAVGPSARSAAVAEGYPLPAVKDGSGRVRPQEEQSSFLFGEKAHEQHANSKVHELLEVQKKIAMIKGMIRKYNSMSGQCQVRVEPVRVYLTNQLRLLERINSEHAGDEDRDECDVKCMHQSKHAVGAAANATATTNSSGSGGGTEMKKLCQRSPPLSHEEVVDRRKRQIEQRLARLFGRTKEEGRETTAEAPPKSDADDLSKAAFEAPLVYSLH